MTLNGVMTVVLRYFGEFDRFCGALRKGSRSLSHLLMSSCSLLLTALWVLRMLPVLQRLGDAYGF